MSECYMIWLSVHNLFLFACPSICLLSSFLPVCLYLSSGHVCVCVSLSLPLCFWCCEHKSFCVEVYA